MCNKSWQCANSSLESLKLVSSVGENFLQCSGLDWSSITEFWELFLLRFRCLGNRWKAQSHWSFVSSAIMHGFISILRWWPHNSIAGLETEQKIQWMCFKHSCVINDAFVYRYTVTGINCNCGYFNSAKCVAHECAVKFCTLPRNNCFVQ